jgi:hypothetical protein
MEQAVGMMDPLSITRDLRADHAVSVGVVLGAVDASDTVVTQEFDIERACRRAIVRARGVADLFHHALLHSVCTRQYGSGGDVDPPRDAAE